jgi:hypothetical protein
MHGRYYRPAPSPPFWPLGEERVLRYLRPEVPPVVPLEGPGTLDSNSKIELFSGTLTGTSGQRYRSHQNSSDLSRIT